MGINLNKVELLNRAIQNYQIKSFADLGGVWNVDGYYTSYILSQHPQTYGYLVDNIANQLTDQVKSLHNLTIINNSFTSSEALEKIKFVDMVIMFDILLHQANPSWQQILEIYGSRTRCFVIYNPQFDLPKSERLINLGKTKYFKNVPHNDNEYNYHKLFINETETNPEYRDCCNFWQWAINDGDLINEFKQLNFKLVHHENMESLGFAVNKSFIFVR